MADKDRSKEKGPSGGEGLSSIIGDIASADAERQRASKELSMRQVAAGKVGTLLYACGHAGKIYVEVGFLPKESTAQWSARVGPEQFAKVWVADALLPAAVALVGLGQEFPGLQASATNWRVPPGTVDRETGKRVPIAEVNQFAREVLHEACRAAEEQKSNEDVIEVVADFLRSSPAWLYVFVGHFDGAADQLCRAALKPHEPRAAETRRSMLQARQLEILEYLERNGTSKRVALLNLLQVSSSTLDNELRAIRMVLGKDAIESSNSGLSIGKTGVEHLREVKPNR